MSETRKGGIPAHEPTEETRQRVAQYAMAGINQDSISELLRIAPKTLRKHYDFELKTSTHEVVSKVAGSLFTKAMKGDTAAQIFLLRTRGNMANKGSWSEPKQEETKQDKPHVIVINGAPASGVDE